jgi:glutamyl-tRNA synthetase
MGPDKKRLSKRHGATSVMEYERQGYIPEGMVNFLSLLGWSPGTDEELLTIKELTDRFMLEGISGGNAVFNTEKLDWFNHQHLLRLPDEELLTRLVPRLQAAGWWRQSLTAEEFPWIRQVLALLRPRAKTLQDYVEGARPFLADPESYDADAVAKHLEGPEVRRHLEALRDEFSRAPFDETSLEQRLRQLAEQRGVKAGALIHATRIAATGRMVSPGLFEMVVLLGRERVVERINRLIEFLA